MSFTLPYLFLDDSVHVSFVVGPTLQKKNMSDSEPRETINVTNHIYDVCQLKRYLFNLRKSVIKLMKYLTAVLVLVTRADCDSVVH